MGRAGNLWRMRRPGHAIRPGSGARADGLWTLRSPGNDDAAHLQDLPACAVARGRGGGRFTGRPSIGRTVSSISPPPSRPPRDGGPPLRRQGDLLLIAVEADRLGAALR